MVFFIAKFIIKLNRKKNEKLKGVIYMNNVNITEKFALCMLKEKKEFIFRKGKTVFNCLYDNRNVVKRKLRNYR